MRIKSHVLSLLFLVELVGLAGMKHSAKWVRRLAILYYLGCGPLNSRHLGMG